VNYTRFGKAITLTAQANQPAYQSSATTCISG